MGMKKLSTTVRSLLASSLGLPGMQDLLAQEAPDDGLSYQFTHYDEQPLPQSKLAFGSPQRYSINSQQLRWFKNLDDTYSLKVEAMYEGMSGSSPWYVIPDPATGPLQVMSGATIREQRTQLDAALSRRHDGFTHTAAVGYSTEDDYQALYGSYAGEKETDDGMNTFSWGASYSHDELEPTDAELYDRVERATRESFSAAGGFTRIINRNALVQTGLSLTRNSGYLSDPYKMVWVEEEVINDSRPDDRLMWTWTVRARQYMERSRAGLQADFRYFGDDWGIRSGTLEIGWHQPLNSSGGQSASDGWEITPSLRYYTQTAPDFYGPVFDSRPGDGYWSSDYRLATFGALSYRLNATLRREGWSAALTAEYYDSSEGLALFGTPQDTPALLDFWRITARFTFNLQ